MAKSLIGSNMNIQKKCKTRLTRSTHHSPPLHKMAAAPASDGSAVDAPISCASATEHYERISIDLSGPERQESRFCAPRFVGEDTFWRQRKTQEVTGISHKKSFQEKLCCRKTGPCPQKTLGGMKLENATKMASQVSVPGKLVKFVKNCPSLCKWQPGEISKKLLLELQTRMIMICFDLKSSADVQK